MSQPQAATNGFFKKQKVPVKFSAIDRVQMTFDNESLHLKDFVTITIAAPNGEARTIVLHHPIGVTNLDRDGWSITLQEEMKPMLANEKDPSADRKKKAEDAKIRELLFAKNFLKKEADGKVVVDPNGKKYDEVAEMNAAKTAFESAKASAYDEYRRKCKEDSKEPKPLGKWGFGKDVSHFLNEGMKTFIADARQKVRESDEFKAWKAKVPVFETRAGLMRERPQKLAFGPEVGPNSQALVDKVHSFIYKNLASGLKPEGEEESEKKE